MEDGYEKEFEGTSPGSKNRLKRPASKVQQYEERNRPFGRIGRPPRKLAKGLNSHPHKVKSEMSQIDTSWIQQLKECPAFQPSFEEFKDPFAYLEKIADQARPYGICKIKSPIRPSEPPGRVLSRLNFKFKTRVQRLRHASSAAKDKLKFMESSRYYTLSDYEKVAMQFASKKLACSAALPPESVEALFWQELAAERPTTVEYGSDLDGSAFSSASADPLARSLWNLQTLPKLKKSILRLLTSGIPGVTDPMLYIGMLFSMFAWHVEDHYLYSINYHHMGAPKTWYGVPSSAAPAFEAVVREKVFAGNEEDELYNLLIGKTAMFSPGLLVAGNVPVYRAVQQPGEFVVTFPRAYHGGFSHGFNCGEAVNFAMADWLEYGAAAVRRYTLLRRQPILAHEELLCHEARHVAAMQGPTAGSASTEGREHGAQALAAGPTQGPGPTSSAAGVEGAAQVTDSAMGFPVQLHVKVGFVRLLRFIHRIRWLLVKLGAKTRGLPWTGSSTACGLCKAMCYVVAVDCDCFSAPRCLNHAGENRHCPCGGRRSVMCHPDLARMEALAQHFEEDPQVRSRLDCSVLSQEVAALNGQSLEESLSSQEEFADYQLWVNIEAFECHRNGVIQAAVPVVEPEKQPLDKQSQRLDAAKAPLVTQQRSRELQRRPLEYVVALAAPKERLAQTRHFGVGPPEVACGIPFSLGLLEPVGSERHQACC